MHDKKIVRFLCINDFHAEIFQTENTSGCARFVTAVEEFKRQYPGTIVLFGGDNYKGDPVSEVCGGKPVTEMMVQMGTVASAVGNHEFDFGTEAMLHWQKEGAYSFVAANLKDTQTGKAASFVKPYIIEWQHGVKIAILGLCMKEPLATVDRSIEMTRYEIEEVVPAAKRWVQYLHEIEEPDAIVALTHLPLVLDRNTGNPIGDEVLSLCQEVPELAGVFTAHLHQFISIDIKGLPVVQAGSSGRGYGVLELHFSAAGVLTESKALYVNLQDEMRKLSANPSMERIVEECKKTAMEKLGREVAKVDNDIWHRDPATNEVPPEGSPFSALGVEVMQQRTGCPVALFYAGRMGKYLKKGVVSLYQLHQLFLFNNGLVTMKLSGKAIKNNIETGLRTLATECASPIAVGGLKVVADMQAPYKKRVISISFPNGEQLKLENIYDVVIDDYLAENPLGFDFSSGIDVFYTGISLRESMIEEICRLGTVRDCIEPSVMIKEKKE